MVKTLKFTIFQLELNLYKLMKSEGRGRLPVEGVGRVKGPPQSMLGAHGSYITTGATWDSQDTQSPTDMATKVSIVTHFNY